MKKTTVLLSATVFALFTMLFLDGCNPETLRHIEAPWEDDLVAYYGFEDSLEATPEGDWNATAKGQPAYVNATVRDKALSLDGQDDWLQIQSKPHLLNDDFSISIWVKYPKQTNGNGYAALLIQSTNPNSPWEGVSIFVGDRVIVRLDRNEQLESKAQGLDDNQWHHLVMVRKKTNLSLYLDGVLDGNRTVSRGAISNKSPIFIGANHEDQTKQLFKGDIDELRIFKRALSKENIELFHGSKI
jgi:hypothetical protein